jgi:hypothetical protein
MISVERAKGVRPAIGFSSLKPTKNGETCNWYFSSTIRKCECIFLGLGKLLGIPIPVEC